MRLRALVAVYAGVAAVAFACGHTYSSGDIEPDAGTEASITPATSNDAGPAEASAPAEPCPAGCLAATPPGWTGPSAVSEQFDDGDASAPTCPVTYPTHEIDTVVADGGIGGGCLCQANPLGNPLPRARTALVYPSATCGGQANTKTLDPGDCVAVSAQAASVRIQPDSESQPCCGTPTRLPFAPLGRTNVTSCTVRVTSECPSRADCTGITAPQAPFTRVCIHTAGDVACPNADYPNRFVSYRSATDNRSCAPCVATPADGLECNMVVGAPGSCADGGVILASDGGCNALAANITSLRVPTVTHCNIDGGQLEGAIETDGAETYCCTN